MKNFWKVLVVFTIFIIAGCGTNRDEQNNVPDNRQMAEPRLSVYMHKTGETKELNLEEYLEGVVAGEMKNDWNINALAAQAIIARTFTLQAFERGNMTSQGTNASTDIEEFQAYNADAVNENVKKAVEMTRGKVATYRGSPIMGWFHASAGGRTADAEEGLDYQQEEPPFIHSVESPDELAPADIQNWTAIYTVDEVMQALKKMKQPVPEIRQVKIDEIGDSGRAETIEFNDDVEVSAPRLRLALGSTKLKSMLLDSVTLADQKITFQGRGYGHGVGMSQWGALKLAMDGKSPEEIIQHYFKDIKIEKRW